MQEDTPQSDGNRSISSSEDIHGMLRAVEDQTARFDWHKLQLAVAAKIGLKENATRRPLPIKTLHGLLSALPMFQHFPGEHLIQVKAELEVCAIVTWAHCILGLDVLVRSTY